MKKLVLILLLIASTIYAQFGRSQYFRKLGNDSLGLGYGLTKLKIDSMIYLRNAGFRFFNNQLQFSNDLLNWYNIPTSLPQGGGWTLGLNKIYQSTTNTPVHIRSLGSDTTGTRLLNIYGDTYVKGRLIADSGLVVNWIEPEGVIFDAINDYYTGTMINNKAVSFYIYPISYNLPILNFGTNLNISINSSNQITYGSGFTNTTTYINGVLTNQLTLNAWNFVVCNYDEITTNTIEIGRYGSSYSLSIINHIRIYNKNLSQSEVIKLYNNGLPHLAELPYTDRGASNAELVTNGSFDTDTAWIKGTGWTISDGKANFVATGSYSELRQGITKIGKQYKITLQVVRLAGTLYVKAGAQGNFTSINASGTYTVISTCAGTPYLIIQADPSFTGSVDDVSCIQIGCVAEYKSENAGTMGWIETQNGLHAVSSGNPIAPVGLRDYKSGISTTTVQLVNTQKPQTILKQVIVKNNYAGSNTFFLGTTTSANELLNGVSIGNGETKVFDVNSYSANERSLYCKAGNSNVDVTLIYEKVAR